MQWSRICNQCEEQANIFVSSRATQNHIHTSVVELMRLVSSGQVNNNGTCNRTSPTPEVSLEFHASGKFTAPSSMLLESNASYTNSAVTLHSNQISPKIVSSVSCNCDLPKLTAFQPKIPVLDVHLGSLLIFAVGHLLRKPPHCKNTSYQIHSAQNREALA